MIDEYKTRQALVTIAIEKSLLKIGNPIYDLVISKLKEKYDCYLPDCYEHPEYLSEILRGLYGDSHKIIIESINSELMEFSDCDGISSFLKVVCK
jgi:predicted transcriptional regulator with HTH domain